MNNPSRYDKRKFPVNPKVGSPEREDAFILNNRAGIAFLGIIQPRNGHPRYRVQGKTLEECEIKMHAKLAWISRHSDGQILKLSAQDERDAFEARVRLNGLGLELRLSVILGAGVRYFEALAGLKLPKDAQGHVKWDHAPDIIKLGADTAERKLLTMGEALKIHAETYIGEPEDPALTEGRTQAAFITSLLMPLVDYFGASTEVRVVALTKNKEKLKSYAKEWIHSEDAGAPTYRAKRWQETIRFFSIMCRHVEVPEPFVRLFGKKPKVPKAPVQAISPEAIAAVLSFQLNKCPEMLLYTLLQALAGFRPEEAYKFLANARLRIVDDSHIVLAVGETKGREPRIVRLRPAFKAWLEKVPGWSDPNVDLVPKDRHGKPRTADSLQTTLNRQLRRIGRWQGKIPKEALRKSWVSACMALKIPKDPHLQAETGHTTGFVIDRHYDALWTKAMALALFSMFPTRPDVMPSEWDLHHAHDQVRTTGDAK